MLHIFVACQFKIVFIFPTLMEIQQQQSPNTNNGYTYTLRSKGKGSMVHVYGHYTVPQHT